MSCSLHVNACFAVDDTTVDDSFPDEVPMFDFCGVKMMRVNFQFTSKWWKGKKEALVGVCICC